MTLGDRAGAGVIGAASGGGVVAGGDVAMTGTDPRERLWKVAREVAAMRKAVQYVNARRGEWTDDWYVATPLDTRQWETHGGSLDLSSSDLAIVSGAYALVEGFNDALHRHRARGQFADPEVPMPDLAALDDALARVERLLDERGVSRS